MRRSQGYTLMEMMVVVLIMSIIITIAVPSFKQLQADNRMAAAANLLAADIKRARGEALVARANLNLVPVSGGDGDPWGGGWSIENLALANVVYKNLAVPPSVVIVGTPAATSLLFAGVNGMVGQPDGTVASFSFLVCDDAVDAEKGFTVSVSNFGRVAVRKNSVSGQCL